MELSLNCCCGKMLRLLAPYVGVQLVVKLKLAGTVDIFCLLSVNFWRTSISLKNVALLEVFPRCSNHAFLVFFFYSVVFPFLMHVLPYFVLSLIPIFSTFALVSCFCLSKLHEIYRYSHISSQCHLSGPS